MDLQQTSSEAEFVEAALAVVREACVSHDGVIRIALSGGSTPAALYRALADTNFPFERIEFYQVDERKIPLEDRRSNQHMIREMLVAPLGTRLKAFYSFDVLAPLEESLLTYEHCLMKIPERQLDVVILGVGVDGHVASLFPFCDALQEEKRLVAYTETEQFDGRERMTMTFPIIMRSRTILVLLRGEEKNTVLETLEQQEKSVEEFPAIKLLEHFDLKIVFGNF